MEQSWFEMLEHQKKSFSKSPWVPLRAARTLTHGKQSEPGFQEEFFGVGTSMFPLQHKDVASKLEWGDIGLRISNSGYWENRKYTPADVNHQGGFQGMFLVLDQHLNGEDHNEWHLHQDFVLTLKLKREGDVWVAPDEGYREVARLTRDQEGAPQQLEVLLEYLRDYLCARKFGLMMTTYRSRVLVMEDASNIQFAPASIKQPQLFWEGRVQPIHRGNGMPYGEEMAVFRMWRTDVETTDEVPEMGAPDDDNVGHQQSTRRFKGERVDRVIGELWKNEWIDPGPFSPRIKRDPVPATVFFITDALGSKESRDTLNRLGRWLWFRPTVISQLLSYRNSHLTWYTQDTGAVACSPDDGVHFGINPLGLINVYAKDIGNLPDWQQSIWAGHNVSPEGGISRELHAAQVLASPAETQAPERFLQQGLLSLNQLGHQLWGVELLKLPEGYEKQVQACHRFRVNQETDLWSLAKDLARLTADCVNATPIKKQYKSILFPSDDDQKLKGLKVLERLMASLSSKEEARALMGPLFGIYNLRNSDAHNSTSEVK